MASKNFYLRIIFRSLLLAGSALFISWLFFGLNQLLPATFILLVFIAQVAELILFVNRTNRQIAWFFDAVRNEDSTLKFPVNTGNRSLNELNVSMNKLNNIIKSVKFELQEQEQYYKTILESVSIGIVTFNDKGTVLLANSASRHFLKRKHLTHINQLKQVDEKLFLAMKELNPGDRKLISFSGNDGMVQLSLKSTVFKTAQDNFQLVAIQDIKNELETKELESWIKLIRVLTHEIMNTIAPITSLSETILNYYKNLDGGKPDEKVIKNTMKGLEVINERGNGLMAFVETYRKLTRLPKPDKQTVSVAKLFESAITLVKSDPNNDNVQISRELNPTDLEIFADKKQFSQVMINLLKNALDAIRNETGGKILLKGEINNEGRTEITVADNGPGIPEDVLDKIFIPFFTTKESGSGIGLSLSRQIMQLHGGSIKVASKEGEFTKVTLVF